MALINCPECKKEISDQAKTCPHCGFPLKEESLETIAYKAVVLHTSKNRYRWLLESKGSVGNLSGKEFSQGDVVKLLDQNNNVLIQTKIDTYCCLPIGRDLTITFGFNDLEEETANNTKYIIKTCSKENEISFDEKPLRCPKCGSTNIQIVPRKWSIWAGVFTNAVDRVCVICKNKF